MGTFVIKKEKEFECNFCGKKYRGTKLVLRDLEIQTKDGSDLVLCSDCLNNYASGDYDKIKLKRGARNKWI